MAAKNKNGSSNEVLEERISSLALRVGDLVDTTKLNTAKLDKVIALEVKQTELHHDVRTTMAEIVVLRDQMTAMNTRIAADLNGVGQRVTTVEGVVSGHTRNFKLIAGAIGSSLLVGVGLLAWLLEELYQGIVMAIKVHS
jgi:hypothetical protein